MQPDNGPLTLASIRETESQIRTLHEQQSAETLQLSNSLVDAIYAGLPLTSGPNISRPKLVVNGMLTNGVNAYIKTVDLATGGYYDFALNMTRILAEDWVSALYVMHDPSKAGRWLDVKRDAPSFSTMLQTIMYERPDYLDKFVAMRDILNNFAHSSPATLAGALAPKPPGGGFFIIGPSLSLQQFDNVLYAAMMFGSQLLGVIRGNGGADVEAWAGMATGVSNEIATWMREYNQRYGSDVDMVAFSPRRAGVGNKRISVQIHFNVPQRPPTLQELEALVAEQVHTQMPDIVAQVAKRLSPGNRAGGDGKRAS